MAQDILYRLNYVYGGDGTSNDTRPTDNYDLNYNFGDKKALIKPAARYRGGLFAERHFLILSTSLREEPPRRGSQVNKAINIAFPPGGRC
mgnify:FL=1